MSQKFFAQHSELVNVPSLPPVNRRSLTLIVIATILVLALGFVMATQHTAAKEEANTSPASAITRRLLRKIERVEISGKNRTRCIFSNI